MRIAFFCWSEELKVRLDSWTKDFAPWPHEFVIIPLIRMRDKQQYRQELLQFQKGSRNTSVAPIYLKSSDSRLRNMLNLKRAIEDFLSIFKVLARVRPQIVICFYILHAYPLAVLRRVLKFSVSVVAMGSDINIDNNLTQKLIKKFVYKNCQLIFACSWKLKERVERESRHKTILIPSAADISFFKNLYSKPVLRRKWRARWGLKHESKIILTVCRLDRNKGVDILIRSLRLLDSIDVYLFIVGEGVEKKNLEKLSHDLGLKEYVRILGFRDKEELLELYNLADLFVLASYSEGLPRALIEAMSCGCIPVVTNVGDITKIVKNGYNGFVVNPGDSSQIAESINLALSLSQREIELIRHRAQEIITADFDTRKQVETIVKSIDALF
jgi:glycosyltransferase involved in cell wall biosynthesis